MVDINIKPKVTDNTPPFMVFFLGIMAGFLIIAFIWGVYEHGADKRYYDCMYDFAVDYCNETGVKDFSAKYSAVRCYPQTGTGFYIPGYEYEEIQPHIFDNATIRTCWNISRSLWYQLQR